MEVVAGMLMCGQGNSACQPTTVRWLGSAARYCCCAAVLIVLVAIARWAPAQTVQGGTTINREYAIKAAFLYNFLKYLQWPANATPAEGQPFVIGVFQDNPFDTALDTIAKTKKVAGHPIEIRRLTSIEGVRECQLLFVSGAVPLPQQNAVLRAARNAFVFVVGEDDDFLQRGGHAQFYLEGNKVRFAFSADAAKREDLKVSSKLLALATIKPSH